MQVGLKSFKISVDYRVYVGSSSRIWSFRRLFLYLCSYKLVGSVTISVNYLDLDQAYATHEFQVQSKFLYQNSLIQNSGEFKAETRYLKGITTEQLFIISIQKIIFRVL